MKRYLPILVLLGFVSLSSCNKDLKDFDRQLAGHWVWKSSHSSGGVQMYSTDSTKVFDIHFNGAGQGHRFINTSFCIIGGEYEGTYQTRVSGKDKLLMLHSNNGGVESLKVVFKDDGLTFIKTSVNDSWFHDFKRK